MKQVEFESKLVALKQEKAKELDVVDGMLLQCEEELAYNRRKIAELEAERRGILAKKRGLLTQRENINQKWYDKIQQFKKDFSSCKRNLEDVSDWALVNEFMHRGFTGKVENCELDARYLEDINRKFSGEKIGGGTNCDTE